MADGSCVFVYVAYCEFNEEATRGEGTGEQEE